MSRLTGAFQSTRAQRLPPATTLSQTRRALCFPSTTAMAASSSGDFATHQMQLRRQRRFCDGDVFRNSGVVFHNGNVFRDDGIFRNAGVFRIKGLCDALYHERVRFFPVLAQICGCERWIFRNAKRALQKTRSEAWRFSKRSEKPFSVTKNRSQPQICARITKFGTRFRQPRDAIFEKPARHPLPMHAWSDAAKSARSKRKWRTPKIIGSPD